MLSRETAWLANSLTPFGAWHAREDGSDAGLRPSGVTTQGRFCQGGSCLTLGVATFEVGDPVVVLDLVKAKEAALDRRPVSQLKGASRVRRGWIAP